MKNKKLLNVICSLSLAATLGVSVLAGCRTEEHVYTWTVNKEATCSETGKRTGKCGICGDIKEEIIPIDPDNHDYGEWEITAPTAEREGSALKICSLNSQHTASSVLPKLTEEGTGYVSAEITKEPTAVAEGERTYVREHPDGNISFTVSVPKREVQNLEDAVLLGSSLGDMVRSSSGRYRYSKDSNYSNFTNYYGNNYTNIKDNGQDEEYWYSLDDKGELFGVYTRNGSEPSAVSLTKGNVDENGNDLEMKRMLGYSYADGASSLRCYGAEDTLSQYYNASVTARSDGSAVNYEEHFLKASDGTVIAGFSYSHRETPHFARYTVEFSLYPSGVIKSLQVDTLLIRGFMIANDASDLDAADANQIFAEDGDVIFAEAYPMSNGENLYAKDTDGNYIIDGVKQDKDGNVLHDAKGNEIPRYLPYGATPGDARTYYSDEHDFASLRTIIYNEPVLKTSDDVVEECPYVSNDLYVSDVNLTYNDAPVGEGVTIPSDKSVIFEVTSVLPSTASLEYDPLSVYIRTAAGDKELTQTGSDNSFNMTGVFLRNEKETPTETVITYSININSKYAGEVPLVLKTASGTCEKVINLTITKSAPRTMSAEVYAYSDAKGTVEHTWISREITDDSYVVYVGQPLYVRATATAEENLYCDTAFKAEAGGSAGKTNLIFTNHIVDTAMSKTGEVSKIVALAPGTYTVTLAYTQNDKVYKNFSIQVLAAPDMSEALSGEYTANVRYISLNGSSTKSATLKVTFIPSEENWKTGKIEIDIDTGSGYGNKCYYNYTFNSSENVLTTEFDSGIAYDEKNNPTQDFSVSINEMFKLSLTHSTGFGTITETVVLSRPK